MTPHTVTSTRKAIYELLAADSELASLLYSPDSIYHAVAPQDAEYPFLLFSKQSGRPYYSFDGSYESEAWIVKGVNREDSPEQAELIGERAQTVLQDAVLPVDGNTLWFRVASSIAYTEIEPGATINHSGAIFSLEIE